MKPPLITLLTSITVLVCLFSPGIAQMPPVVPSLVKPVMEAFKTAADSAGLKNVSAKHPADTTGPVLPKNSIIFNNGGVLFAVDTLQCSSAAATDQSGIRAYYFKLNNGAEQKSASPKYTFKGLTDGHYTVSVCAEDNAGNRGNAETAECTIDRTPPVLKSGSLRPDGGNTLIAADSITCRIALSDIEEKNGIAHYSFRVDSGKVVSGTEPVFIARGLSDGRHTIAAKAEDRAGNKSQPVSFTVTVDRTPPDVASARIELAGGKKKINTLDASLVVEGIKDANGVKSINYSIDGGAAAVLPPGPRTLRLPGAGAHRVSFTAIDSAGNVSAPVVRDIIVDLEAPKVVLFKPKNDGMWNAGEWNAGFIFSEPMDHAAKIAIKLDTLVCPCKWAGADTLEATCAIGGSMKNGKLPIIISGAQDEAGNAAAPGAFTATVDTKPPVLKSGALRIDGNVSLTNADSVTCRALAADIVEEGSGISRYFFRVDSGKVETSTEPVYVVRGLGEGKHTIAVKAEDRCGNRSQPAEAAVTVDRTPPDLSAARIELAGGRKKTNTREVALVIEGVKDSHGVKSMEYTLDGGGKNELPMTVAGKITVGGSGVHKLVFQARDSAGNLSAPVQREITIDLDAPKIVSFKAANDGFWGEGERNAMAVFSKPMDASAKIVVKIDKTVCSQKWLGADTLAIICKVSAGMKQGKPPVVVLGAKDQAGNDAIDSVAGFVTIDTKAPVVKSVVSDNGKTLISADTLAVKIADVQDDAGAVRYYFRVDSGKVETGTEPKFTVRGLSEGKHAIAVKAEDRAGNKSQPATLIVTVDRTPPAVTSVKCLKYEPDKGVVPVQVGFSEAMDSTQKPLLKWNAEDLAAGKWVDAKKYEAYYSVSVKSPFDSLPVAVSGFRDIAGNSDKNEFFRLQIPVEAMVASGARCKTAQDLAGAAAAFSKVKARLPGRIDVRQQLADVYRLQKDGEREEKELVELAGLTPQDGTIYKRLAELSFARKDYGSARKYVTHLLIAEGKTDCLEFDNYYDEKRPLYYILPDEFLDKSADLSMESTFFIWEGIDAARAKDYERAFKQFTRARMLDSASLMVTYNLGTVLIRQGKYKEAVEVFKKAAPKLSGIYAGNYAVALALNGDEKAAIEVYNRQKELLDNPLHCSNYGVLLANRDGPAAGLPYFEKSARAAAGTVPQFGINYAFALYGAGKYGEASGIFSKFSDSTSRVYPDIYFGQALCSEKQGNAGAALASLRRAVAAVPYYLAALLKLGELEYAKGSFESARQVYEQIVVLSPDNYLAKQQLSSVYQKLGLDAKSREMAIKSIKSRKAKHEKPVDARNVAVLRFKNLLKDTSLNWIEIAGAEAVTNLMQSASDYQMIERINIEKMFAEKALSQADDEKTASSQVNKTLGAWGLISGSFQIAGKNIRMDARLVEVETGKIVTTATATGKLDDIAKMENDLALKLAGVAEEPAYQAVANQISLSAQRKMAESWKQLYAGNRKKAQEISKQAMAMDPNVLSVLDEAVLVSEEEAHGKTLAVLPFSNVTKNIADDWMSIGIEEAMITDLKKIAGLYMVERTQVKKLMEEMALGQSGAIDESSAPKVGKLLSAGVVLMGSYQTVGDEIKITARMITAESGEVHLATDVRGKKDNVLQLEEDLALKIIEALHINISTYEQRKIINKDPLALKTLQEKMTSEVSEKSMDDVMKKINAMKKSYTGKILFGSSIASTIITGVFGAMFYSDYNAYMNEKVPAQVVRKGDRAEVSYNTALVSGAVTGAVWCATGGYYAVRKWLRHEPATATAGAGGKNTAGAKK